VTRRLQKCRFPNLNGGCGFVSQQKARRALILFSHTSLKTAFDFSLIT
jgi:hypothetical protein